MKKLLMVVFAGLMVHTAAFAEVGPNQAQKCKEIAAKVKAAKAAAVPGSGESNPVPGDGTTVVK